MSQTPAATDPSGERRLWLRRTLWLVGGLAAVRVAVAVAVPLDLAPDEAYYWDWSRRLDWGYFSKPPLVAWLNALSTSLLGTSPFSIRLSAVILGTFGLFWPYLLASRLYGPRVGFWAVVLIAATPGNAVLSLLMTIDVPFLFCWSAALYCLWRFLEQGRDRLGWGLALALATGLGLISKEAMLGFFPLAGLFLLTDAKHGRELLRPAFWLWILGALLFLTPVIWWNSRHGWITVRHSLTHFRPEAQGWLDGLSLSAEFLGGQLGLLSPVTCGLLIAGLGAGIWRFRTLGRRERYLICFSGLPVLAVLALSLTRRVQPNWPAALYPAAIVLVAGWALNRAQIKWRLRRGRRVLIAAVSVGVISVAVLYLLAFGVGVELTALDRVGARLRGWRLLGQAVGLHLAEMPQPDQYLVIAATNRDAASELAFYLPIRPRVYLWNDAGDIRSQYDLWGGPHDAKGRNALIVTRGGEQPPGALAAAFARVEKLAEVRVPIAWNRSRHYCLWRGIELRDWPQKSCMTR